MQDLIGSDHGHPAEVGNQMGVIGVTCKLALGTSLNILATKREKVATVTAPIRANVRKILKAMRYAVIDPLFFWIGLVI